MIGKTLAHYQVLEKLGADGMGVVYRAIDTRLQRPVAIKVVDRHASADAAGTRLLREVRLASSLNHPNICTVYEVVEPEVTSRSEGFIAMELVEGRLPFEGRSVSELTAAILRDAIPDLGSSVSPQLQSVIRRCLAKDPAQRYQRAGEVRAALDTIQAARPSETRETRFAVRRWLWVVSATIALAAAIVAFVLWRQPRPHTPLRSSVPEANEYLKLAEHALTTAQDPTRMRQLIDKALALDPTFAPARVA